jgi:hemolysin activation/secretion protein
VTTDSLERAMLLVRDLPGSKMPTVAVAAGTAPGTSDFEVNVGASQLVSGYLMGDNDGSRYTGTKRLYGGVNMNSLLGMADQFSISAMTAEAGDLQNLRAAYSVPLAYNGLRLELAAAKTTYSLGGVYQDLNAAGLVDSLEGTILYPYTRSRAQSIDFSVSFARKWLRDDLSAVDTLHRRSATVATLAAQRQAFGQLFGRSLFTTVSSSIDIGNINPNAGTENGTPTGIYSKLDLGISGNLAVTNKLSALASLKLQKALTGGALDSSEQMFLSGSSGVKSYTEGVSGDNGYLLNVEMRHTLPALGGIKHAAGVFADSGGVYAQNSHYALSDKIFINDVGVGYYANFKPFFATVQMAQSVGSMAHNAETSGTRGFVQVGMAF